VLILENSVYSVITPEGCAAILWKSAKHAPEAAKALRMTSSDLKDLGIVDDIIPEPPGGAHRDPVGTAANIKAYLMKALHELDGMDPEVLLAQRFEKFRAMGRFTEAKS